jgi:hypothetical protein
VSVREQRIAKLRARREVPLMLTRDYIRERHFYEIGSAPRMRAIDLALDSIRRVRAYDAKIAKASLTPFMRGTILRMARHVHQGSTSALFGAVIDIEKWVNEQ